MSIVLPDLTTRKVSISSVSSTTSSIGVQKRVRADTDNQSILYSVYAMETFTFGSPSTTRSHASQDSRQSVPRIAQTSHPPSQISSVDNDSSSPISMIFSTTIERSSSSNPTTPSQFTFDGDAESSNFDGAGSEVGEEYEISIGSTRYEDSISSSRRTSNISDVVHPPPRTHSLRPTLNIQTSPAPPFDADSILEEPTTARAPAPAFHYPTRAPPPPPAEPPQDFDTSWTTKFRSGIVYFDIDENDTTASPPRPRESVSSSSQLNTPISTTSAAAPTRFSFFSRLWKDNQPQSSAQNDAITIPADTFESHAFKWANSTKWTFTRSITPADQRRKDNKEIWVVPAIDGVYSIKRMATVDPISYQLVMQHHPTDSKKSQSPVLLIHKHSKAQQAFSLGWVTRESRSNPSSSKTPNDDPPKLRNRKHGIMHLLATRQLQQSFTNTATVRKLEDYGLLNVAGETTSAPSVMYTPPPNVASTSSLPPPPPPPPLPSKHLQPQPSPSSSDSDTEGEEDSDGIFRVKRKNTSHYEAFGTISAAQMIKLRGHFSGQSHVSLVVNHTDREKERQREKEKEDERLVRRLIATSKPLPKDSDAKGKGKQKQKDPSRSAPAYLESHYVHNNLSSITDVLAASDTSSASSDGLRLRATVAPFTPWSPPWLTIAPKTLTHTPDAIVRKEKEQRRVVENLSRSFKAVGLTSELRHTQSQSQSHSHKSSKGAGAPTSSEPEIRATVFEGIPHDALFMLLPLWIGEMQMTNRDEIRFLLIWYKIWDPSPSLPPPQNNTFTTNGDGIKSKSKYSLKSRDDDRDMDKRQTISAGSARSFKSSVSNSATVRSPSSKTQPESSSAALERDKKPKPFHVLARLVSYNELKDSGIRMPDFGLVPTASTASSSLPSTSKVPVEEWEGVRAGGDQILADYILARCPASSSQNQSHQSPDDQERSKAVEFDETCMLRLGLAYSSPFPTSTSSTSASSSSKSSMSMSSTTMNVKLTPLGRTIVEMAWMGAVAIREIYAQSGTQNQDG